MVQELKEAEAQRDETNLDPEAFAVYWYLNKAEVPKALDVARTASSAFDRYPHWQTSTHQEQDVRRALYKALIDAGVDKVVDIAQGIMRMLRRSSS